MGSALASGLTMATVSADPVELRIICRTGSDDEKAAARKLLPVVTQKPHHRLLVTLLLMNCVFNECMPLFLDNIIPTWASALVSVTAVLILSEILPASFCTGPDKLAIAAKLAPIVWVVLWAMTPIALPIAHLLDYFLPDDGDTLSRNEVRALIEVHREIARDQGHAEPFNEDEEDMIRGALSLGTLTADAADVLTPTAKLFSLSHDAILDGPTLKRIHVEGYSRVPVHDPRDASLCVGYLMVKDFIVLNSNAKTPVSSLYLYQPVCASPTLPLSSLLNEFQTGSSHMAFITHDPGLMKKAMEAFGTTKNGAGAHAKVEAVDALSSIQRAKLLGIVTLEDVLEVLLTEQVYDEGDRREATTIISKFLLQVAIPVLKRRITSRIKLRSETNDCTDDGGDVYDENDRTVLVSRDVEEGVWRSPLNSTTKNPRRDTRTVTRDGQHISIPSFGGEKLQKPARGSSNRSRRGGYGPVYSPTSPATDDDDFAGPLREETLEMLQASRWNGEFSPSTTDRALLKPNFDIS